MARMKLLDNVINNATGQVEGYSIIRSIQQKSNVKGSDYLDLVLGDAEGEIAAKLWDYDPALHGTYHMDDIVKVRGTVNIWKDAEQLKIDRIRNAEEGECDMADLVPCAPFASEWMFNQLREAAEKLNDPDIARLTLHLLDTNRDALLNHPAAVKLHHAQRGGLLYHTMTMLRAAQCVCGIYTALDTDLVFAGVILHDIAKLTELAASELGLASGYTTRGKLIGHISMGVVMIEETAKELQIPAEVTDLLSHILLAHHGTAEYGSPRPPMFPEAEVVSLLDLLDSRMFEMFDALSGVPIGGFSEKLWSLDNRQLYQHGHNFKAK